MTPLNSRASAEDRQQRELLAHSARGSREAFGRLYELLYTPLVRFIYRYTRSHPLIEEILNDTMLVVWQKADTFRGESRVMTWVLGIASRRAMKAVRRERSWHGLNGAAAEAPVSDSETGRLATLEALDWAMEQLNTEQRLAIELAYFHGMSCEEMAEVLDCPLNTAKTRLHYGRRRLRSLLTGDEQALEFSDLIDEVSP
jgi:RNA polymerase sigma-70 factor, ECF subfamily